jgi:hypothetical protein
MKASLCGALTRMRLFCFPHASSQGPGNHRMGFQMAATHRRVNPGQTALGALLGVFLASTTTAEASAWKDSACSSTAPSKACCKTRATANCCCTAVPAAPRRSRTDAIARWFDGSSRAASLVVDRGSQGSACECNSDRSDLPDSNRRRRADDPRPALEQARYAGTSARIMPWVPGSPAQGESVRTPRWPLYLRVSHLVI